MEEKTVQKHYNNLKWFLNWAIRKGYCQEEAVSKYRPKFKVLDKPVIFLTKEEHSSASPYPTEYRYRS